MNTFSQYFKIICYTAVSIHKTPRTTKDLDLESNWKKANDKGDVNTNGTRLNSQMMKKNVPYKLSDKSEIHLAGSSEKKQNLSALVFNVLETKKQDISQICSRSSK